jgi:L-fuconolactonase
MEIIDAQIHEPAPWLSWAEAPQLRNRFATEAAIAGMEAAGVDAAVINARDEWAEYAATQFPKRFASVITVDDPGVGDIDERIANMRNRPGVLGIRVVLTYPRTGEKVERLKQGGYRPLFEAAARHKVPTCVFVCGDSPLAGLIAEQHPDLTLIVDHLGINKPPISTPDDPPFLKLPDVLALARYPNIAVKVSGTPTHSRQPYPFEDLWPHLHKVLNAFGPQRLMWGTDIMSVSGRAAHGRWPDAVPAGAMYPGKHTWSQAVGYLRDTNEVSQQDKELLFAGTLRRLFRWPRS